MEVAPFFVDFHHFLSIFTIFYQFPDLRTFVAIYILSRFTHFFRKFFFAKIAFSVTSHVFCMYGFCLRNVFFSHGFVSCTAFGLVCFFVFASQCNDRVVLSQQCFLFPGFCELYSGEATRVENMCRKLQFMQHFAHTWILPLFSWLF